MPLEERIVLDAAALATTAVDLHAFDNATVVYVDQNATGSVHNGLSWKTAYVDLQTALLNATGPEKIMMAGGTYTPGSSPDSTFNLPNDVLIVGGAKGGTTILSGNLSGGGHVNTVVTANGVTAILENLTITGGVNSSTGNGGGLSETNGSNILLKNDIFKNNSTTIDIPYFGGGAIYSSQSILTVSDSQFLNNTTNHIGGAIWIYQDSLVTIENSNFTNNSANELGGAIVSIGTPLVDQGYYGVMTLNNDTFTNNTVASSGGALFISDVNVVNISRSVFSNNTAGAQGGAVDSQLNNSVNISASKFLNNNGAQYGGALTDYADNALVLTNNLFKGNTANDPAGGYGGALDIEPFLGSIVIQKNIFINNSALYGGAIDTAAENGPVTISDNLFINNKASVQGGAYWDAFESGVALSIKGNVFAGNTAPQGSAIWLDGSAPVNGQTDPAQIMSQLVHDNAALFSNDIYVL